jgi:hypothetical protein
MSWKLCKNSYFSIYILLLLSFDLSSIVSPCYCCPDTYECFASSVDEDNSLISCDDAIFSKTRLSTFATAALHVINFFSLDFSWRLMLFAIELNIDDEHDEVETDVMRH